MEEFNKSLSNQIWASSGKIRIRPLENETNYEFKERKREIFLVKYTLQAKLDEIECYKAREAKEEKKVSRLQPEVKTGLCPHCNSRLHMTALISYTACTINYHLKLQFRL